MNIQLKNIPQEMKDLPNWVCWRYVETGKRPYNPKIPFTNKTPYRQIAGKANNPKTWADFDTALQAMHSYGYDGLGFEFSQSPFVGIDIDHCIDTAGNLDDDSRAIIETLASYTEISPSGKGVHCIVKADIQGSGHRRGRLEVYPQGRFFTITGNVWGNRGDIVENTQAVKALLQRMANKEKPKAQPVEDADSYLDVIIAIQSSKHGPLWRGEKQYPSQSEADQALMNVLAFWTGGNKEQMKALFLQSPIAETLSRKKGHKADYLERTAIAALKNWNGESYDPAAYLAKKGILQNLVFPVTEPVLKGGEVIGHKPIREHWENTAYLLARLNIRVRLNSMTKTIEFTGGGLEGVSLDNAVTTLRGLFIQNRLKILRQDLYDNLYMIADKNRYSPICEYLKKCRKEWDGADHIADFMKLFEFDGTSTQDVTFCKTLIRHWLLSCVAMAFNTGRESADGVLVLIGPQGIGKTRFLYTLAPVTEWVQEGMTLDPARKDDILTAIKFWIVELGEFGETLKKEKLDRLKAFFTMSKDTIRPPYKKAAEMFPRNTVFLATVNERQFLKDDTGDRRYWPVSVTAVHQSTTDIGQLWGQLMHLYFDLHESPHLSEKERRQLNGHNEPYKRMTTEEQILLESLDWQAPVKVWRKMTATSLCEELEINKSHVRLVGRAISYLADRDTRIKKPTNHHSRTWLVPPKKVENCTVDEFTDIADSSDNIFN